MIRKSDRKMENVMYLYNILYNKIIPTNEYDMIKNYNAIERLYNKPLNIFFEIEVPENNGS
jgi:hypothetical protein